MSFFQAFQKPQYVLRPGWAIRRLLIKIGLSSASNIVRLPWGKRLHVDTKDTLGWALATQGVYDLVTTEVLWRLAEVGSTVFDVGANIGYLTTLLSLRVGPQGLVVAFEPHPETVTYLKKNVAEMNNIRVENVALSDREGEGSLDNFPDQEMNTSFSFLTNKPSSKALTVKTIRGDRYVTGNLKLMKIDAQWHEASVLEGFRDALNGGSIRDIVFEEDATYPAQSHKILLEAGYKIFWFDQRLSGPVITPATQRLKGFQSYEIMPSYLATRDEDRVCKLLAEPGWQSLRGRTILR